MEHKLALYITDFIDKDRSKTELDRIKITYGMEILLDNLLKFLFIFVLSVLLGIAKEAMFVLIGFGVLRLKAGGMHCKRNSSCWIVSTLVTIGGGFFGKLDFISLEVGGFMFVISMVILLIYAPAGTDNCPVEFSQKKKLKTECMGIVLLYAVISGFMWEYGIGGTLLVGGFFEACSMIPFIMRLGRRL